MDDADGNNKSAISEKCFIPEGVYECSKEKTEVSGVRVAAVRERSNVQNSQLAVR